MRKGETTRQSILAHAVQAASSLGLEGLTIGRLAADLQLSKSGLYAHFQSKESLQIQVLDQAAEQFAAAVIRPVLATPRGLPRIGALFDRWSSWVLQNQGAKGCIFLAAAVELDDQPGPVRDHLVKLQKDWVGSIQRIFESAVQCGDFEAGRDSLAFAQELHGILFGLSFYVRLLDFPQARERARDAFDALIQRHQSRH
jgi:AcrR family transcriptional regulator